MADLGQIPEIPVEIHEKSASSGRKIIMTILTVFIGIVVGGAALYFVGPIVGITGKPGEDRGGPGIVIGDAQLRTEIDGLRGQLDSYRTLGSAQDVNARLDEHAEYQQTQGTIDQLRQKMNDTLEKEAEYDELTVDLENLNESIASAQENLEGAQRQNAEALSRLSGLRIEVAELEVQVGKLDVADGRRQAVKNALLRDVEQLIIQIRKGIPLAPPEYRKDARLARARKLRDELEQDKWVRPQLLEQYTQLYLEELVMAAQEKYFLAKIPLVEKKKPVMKWAECVSIGNRQVYFETLDRVFTGVCRDTNPGGAVPRYQLLVDLPRTELMKVRDIMAQYRPEDYEQRIKVQLGESVELVGKRSTAAQEEGRAS